MAQITVYAQTGITNWDSANGWNTVAGGGGTAYTDPQNGGGNTFICDLNGKTVALNKDVTVDQIQASTSTGNLTVSATRTINGNLSYSSSSTSGMVRPSAGTLTVNGSVTNSSSGYCIAGSSTASLVIANGTSDALIASGAGTAVYWGSTGNLTITGNLYAQGTVASAYCLNVLAAASVTINGNVYDPAAISSAYKAITCSAGSVTINGNATLCGSGSTTSSEILFTSSANLTINGTVSRTSTGSGTGIYFNSTGTITLNNGSGTVITGGASSGGTAVIVVGTGATGAITGNLVPVGCVLLSVTSGGSGTVSVTGDVTAGTGSVPVSFTGSGYLTLTGNVTAGANHAITHSATGTLTVNGNITGSDTAAAYGINWTGAGALIHTTGTISPGLYTNAYGVYCSSGSSGCTLCNVEAGTGRIAVQLAAYFGTEITITGTVTAKDGYPAIVYQGTGTRTFTVQNMVYASDGTPPIIYDTTTLDVPIKIKVPTAGTVTAVMPTASGTRTLTTADGGGGLLLSPGLAGGLARTN